MIKRKLGMVGRFACLYVAVFILGSAIFGVLTEHVGDYQLLRLIIMSAVAALIMTAGVTVFRIHSPRLKRAFREAATKGHGSGTVIFKSGEFFSELLVTIVTLLLAATLLLFSEKQLLKSDAITNTTLATYIVLAGTLSFLLLDAISWAITAVFLRKQ